MANWTGLLEHISGQDHGAYKARSWEGSGDGFSVGMQGAVGEGECGAQWRGWQGSGQEDILRRLGFVLRKEVLYLVSMNP